MEIRLVPPTVAVLLMVAVGCRPTGRPLDPSVADEELNLPGEKHKRFGSAVGYEHQIRGDILAERGDFAGALNEFKLALGADPSDFYLRIRLASGLIKLGELSKAHRHIKKVLKWDSTNEYAWLALAEYHLAKNDTDEAYSAARRAMRVEPRSAKAALWLAGVYIDAEDSRRAGEILRRVIEASPSNAEARLKLGEVSLSLGDYLEARRQLAVFAEIRPHRADAIAKLASAYLKTGDPGSGADLLAIAVSKDQSNTKLRIQLIRLLIDLKQKNRAQRHLISLPPLKPDDTDGGLERACLFALADRPYHARELLLSHVGSRPKDTNARLVLAELEIILGRLENAELLLEEQETEWTDEQLNQRKQLQKRLSVWPDGSPPCTFLDM
ncbi:MAG: tetratricopeptide repeat protein [Proteobacteria bacterium]|nr:tetratricopeptide repeat protein [Pseudomonadota bacterium]